MCGMPCTGGLVLLWGDKEATAPGWGGFSPTNSQQGSHLSNSQRLFVSAYPLIAIVTHRTRSHLRCISTTSALKPFSLFSLCTSTCLFRPLTLPPRGCTGRNTISYRIGPTVVLSAYIYLLRWDSKLVISDVDGTITRSDVLGHLLPALGVDWSHAGISQLFTNVAAAGYQVMYLSSRSIGQANITRDYLNTIVQVSFHCTAQADQGRARVHQDTLGVSALAALDRGMACCSFTPHVNIFTRPVACDKLCQKRSNFRLQVPCGIY